MKQQPQPKPAAVVTLDQILDAYEQGLICGQDFNPSPIPYPSASLLAHAFVRGMARGMSETDDTIVFEAPTVAISSELHQQGKLT